MSRINQRILIHNILFIIGICVSPKYVEFIDSFTRFWYIYNIKILRSSSINIKAYTLLFLQLITIVILTLSSFYYFFFAFVLIGFLLLLIYLSFYESNLVFLTWALIFPSKLLLIQPLKEPLIPFFFFFFLFWFFVLLIKIIINSRIFKIKWSDQCKKKMTIHD
jgi:hypothetical protein